MTINETNLKFGAMNKRKSTTMIIIHHAAAKTCSAEDIHRWHLENGWSGFGYHFLVRKDGSIWRGRPEDTVGAHTINYNSFSVAVCFEGNFEVEQMPDVQKQAGMELVAYLKDKYSVTDVRKHGELRATDCPGKYFPFDEIANSGTLPATRQTQPDIGRVKQFQLTAVDDGFKFPKFGTDGIWGDETEEVATDAIVRIYNNYKYKNLTKIVQKEVGVTVDGLCGKDTAAAIRKYQEENGLEVDGTWGVNCWKHWTGVAK